MRFVVLIFAAAILAGCEKKPEAPAAPPPAVDAAGNAAGEDVEPLSFEDAPPFVGAFAADPQWCGRAPGSIEASPIVITESEFLGYENRCRIGSIDQEGDGLWRISMLCQSDDVETLEEIEVAVDGAAMTITRGEAAPVAFLRCS